MSRGQGYFFKSIFYDEDSRHYSTKVVEELNKFLDNSDTSLLDLIQEGGVNEGEMWNLFKFLLHPDRVVRLTTLKVYEKIFDDFGPHALRKFVAKDCIACIWTTMLTSVLAYSEFFYSKNYDFPNPNRTHDSDSDSEDDDEEEDEDVYQQREEDVEYISIAQRLLSKYYNSKGDLVYEVFLRNVRKDCEENESIIHRTEKPHGLPEMCINFKYFSTVLKLMKHECEDCKAEMQQDAKPDRTYCKTCGTDLCVNCSKSEKHKDHKRLYY